MIEEYRQTIGHNRGYPTGLSHEEKMDVIACLLDEGEKFYVNEEYTDWISENQCRVGEMVTLDESSIIEHTIVRKANESDLAFGYLLGKVQVRSSGHTLVAVAVLGDVFRLKLKRPAPADILPNTRIYIGRARRVSADIQKNGIFIVGRDRTGFTKKWAMEFLEKITAYPNEAIHDDCMVAFTGAYEK